jgi:hypothetical protein
VVAFKFGLVNRLPWGSPAQSTGAQLERTRRKVSGLHHESARPAIDCPASKGVEGLSAEGRSSFRSLEGGK